MLGLWLEVGHMISHCEHPAIHCIDVTCLVNRNAVWICNGMYCIFTQIVTTINEDAIANSLTSARKCSDRSIP
jgi:hypothetical protein